MEHGIEAARAEAASEQSPTVTPALVPAAPAFGPSGLTIFGWLFFIAGLIAAGTSFMLDTTVSSYSSASGLFPSSSGSTYNLGLLQQQMMLFQAGAGSMIIGAVLLAGGGIVRAVRLRLP